jgi:hypothetical protein
LLPMLPSTSKEYVILIVGIGTNGVIHSTAGLAPADA